jgi:hypothetical protein
MAVCFLCGIEEGAISIPKHNGLIGWIGQCQVCSLVKKVYANVHFGVNPQVKVDTQVVKSDFLRE